MARIAMRRLARPRRSNAQQGDVLIEALLAMLLSAVIGLGLSYATMRMLHAQRQMNAQNMAVQQMREELVQKGFSASDICESSDEEQFEWTESAGYTPSGGVVLFTVSCDSTTVNVNGIDIALKSVKSMNTEGQSDSEALFGGDGELRITAY